jgi:hypothetical protein
MTNTTTKAIETTTEPTPVLAIIRNPLGWSVAWTVGGKVTLQFDSETVELAKRWETDAEAQEEARMARAIQPFADMESRVFGYVMHEESAAQAALEAARAVAD